MHEDITFGSCHTIYPCTQISAKTICMNNINSKSTKSMPPTTDLNHNISKHTQDRWQSVSQINKAASSPQVQTSNLYIMVQLPNHLYCVHLPLCQQKPTNRVQPKKHHQKNQHHCHWNKIQHGFCNQNKATLQYSVNSFLLP